MSTKLIEGGNYIDARGSLRFINDFDMSDVKRFYAVTHPDTNVVRAWQGHKVERKYFFCVTGKFKVAAVKVDDWNSPSENLIPEHFELTADRASILAIPGGYANGFKAIEPNSTLIVYSSHSLADTAGDDFRFDRSLWHF